MKLLKLYWRTFRSGEIDKPIVLATFVIGVLVGYILWVILVAFDLFSVLLSLQRWSLKRFQPTKGVSP